MSHARNIGRLGALAVALGIGYSVADVPAFADTPDAAGAETNSSQAQSPREGKVRVSSPVRRGGPAKSALQAPTAAPDNTPRSAAADTLSRVGAEEDSAAPVGQNAAPPIPSAAIAEQVASASVAASRQSSAQAPEVTPESTAYSTPEASARPGVTVPAPSAALVTSPAPAVAVVAPARPAAAAPRMLPASTTAQLVSTALAPLLGGSTGGAPNQAPMLFSVLAWARKEFERLIGVVPPAAVTTTSQVQSPNLLVNPGAELGDPSLSGYSAVTIPGWTLTGTPTVIKYGAPRNLWPIGTSFPMPNLPGFLGYPKAKSGPADGGNQFFGGGDVTTGTLTQTVDLRSAAADIDLGTTTYNLSGWLGGYLSDPSGASVKVDFLDANKTYLGSAALNRVGPLERWFQTGFKQRSTAGTLPTGTRYAQVAVTLEDRNWVTFGIPWLLGGVDFDYNYAFADNIAFTVGATLPAPPAPTPPVSTVGELDHVFMVYMENKGYTDIVGSTKAPFLNSLINAYGHANQYHGLTHPSLPNYYPVIGGTDFGLTYNCATPCIDADTTLVSNITAAGKTWKGYAQSLAPGASPLVASGDYSPDQLPFPAFKSIANNPAALANIVPLQQMAEDLKSVATAPNYAWFAANEDFNGEGPVDFPWGMLRFALSQLEPGNPYNIPALDQFLSENVPVVLNSAVWKDPTRKSALVVTFDEDNNNTSLGFGNQGNRVVFVVIPSQGAIAAGMRGGAFTATNHYNHYSLLRFIEDSLGLPTLTNNDKFAAPLNEFWDSGVKGGAGSLV
jgi:hypothetical protein